MQIHWAVWSFIAMISFAVLTLLVTFLRNSGLSTAATAFYFLFPTTIMFGALLLFQNHSLAIPPQFHKWVFPLAFFTFTANYAIITAFELADNPGFVKVIGMLEAIVVTIVYAALQQNWQDLTLQKLIGTILAISGAILISLD
ncbi:MAG: hypothetical protein HC796_02050 [Synechococcaceae cyanobacterium RL_1_2]|nr:hypothetical protein [Synechococcaceae cyanobacterium RL_1_2]